MPVMPTPPERSPALPARPAPAIKATRRAITQCDHSTVATDSERFRAAANVLLSARLFAQNILLWSAAASAGGERTWRPPAGRPGDRSGSEAGAPGGRVRGDRAAVPGSAGLPRRTGERGQRCPKSRRAPVEKKVRTAPGAEQQQRCRSRAPKGSAAVTMTLSGPGSLRCRPDCPGLTEQRWKA